MGEQPAPPLTAPRLSHSAPFDKTANITFSLNADDDNVSAASTSGGQGLRAVSPLTLLPLYPQPNANLLEICYKDRIQQFDDDEEEEDEEEGQGSGESDGEDGAWQGSQLARGARLGQPPGVR